MYKLLLSAVLLTTTLLSVNGASFEFCRNDSISYTEFGENVLVTSPGYPEQYDRSTSCTVNLILSTDIPAVLHITQYIPTTPVCSVPYLIADAKGSVILNQNKACSQKDDLNIYNNVVPILSNEQPSAQLILSVAAELADGFNLTLTVSRPQPSTAVTQSMTFPSQQTTFTSQPTTFTSQPTTFTSQPTTFTSQPMTFTTQLPTSTTPNSFSKSSSTNPERQTKTTDGHPTLTSTSQPANDMVVTAVGVGAGITGFIVGVVVSLLTQLLYQRCRGDTSSKIQTDSLEAADESAPEYMIPTVQLDVLTSARQDVDTTGVDTADVTHRYSYVDLPIAPLPTTATSSNEYMTLNTTSISIADAAEEQNINDAHLYDTLQNTEER